MLNYIQPWDTKLGNSKLSRPLEDLPSRVTTVVGTGCWSSIVQCKDAKTKPLYHQDKFGGLAQLRCGFNCLVDQNRHEDRDFVAGCCALCFDASGPYDLAHVTHDDLNVAQINQEWSRDLGPGFIDEYS